MTDIAKTFRSLAAAALTVTAVAALAGCEPADPLAMLQQARAEHELRLRTWSVRTVENENGPQHTGLLSVLVVDNGSPLELDCLTVDVTFEGPNGAKLGGETREIAIGNLASFGGSQDVTVEVDLPSADVEAIGIDLHIVEPDALRSLCEAKAISTPS